MNTKKSAWWDFGRKMDEYSGQNQKNFNRVLKTIRRESITKVIKVLIKQGELTKHNIEAMNRLTEYFKLLLEAVVENCSGRRQPTYYGRCQRH